MSTKLNINVDKLVSQQNDKLQTDINGLLDTAKEEVDKRTPEDTRTLLGNNQIEPATQRGNKIVGKVFNDTEYAKFVEFGVQGKTFKYHKPKGNVFYTGVGARMFTRTADFITNNLAKLFGGRT